MSGMYIENIKAASANSTVHGKSPFFRIFHRHHIVSTSKRDHFSIASVASVAFGFGLGRLVHEGSTGAFEAVHCNDAVRGDDLKPGPGRAQGGPRFCGYPLVMTNIAMENHHF